MFNGPCFSGPYKGLGVKKGRLTLRVWQVYLATLAESLYWAGHHNNHDYDDFGQKRHSSRVALLSGDCHSLWSGLHIRHPSCHIWRLEVAFGACSIWQLCVDWMWREENIRWSPTSCGMTGRLGKRDVPLTRGSHDYGGITYGDYVFACCLSGLKYVLGVHPITIMEAALLATLLELLFQGRWRQRWSLSSLIRQWAGS